MVLLFVGVFIAKTDFREVHLHLRHAGAGIIWVIPITFCAYLLGTLGWRYCLSRGDARNIPFINLFIIRQVTETVALFNPASIIGADMMKKNLLKHFRVNDQTIVRSIVASRILMIFSQVTLLFVALCWLAASQQISGWYPVASLLLIAALLLFICLFRNTGEGRPLSEPATWRNRISWLIRRLQITVHECTTHFRLCPRATGYAFICFTLHWLIGSLKFYILLKLIGAPVTVIRSVMMDMGVIVTKSIGAFIPGQAGIEELGNKLMLMSAGIRSTAVWLAISALRRFRQLLWIVLLALLYPITLKKQPAINNGSGL